MKNPKVVIFSLIAILSIILALIVHWTFIIIAVILMILNQKELMSKKSKK